MLLIASSRYSRCETDKLLIVFVSDADGEQSSNGGEEASLISYLSLFKFSPDDIWSGVIQTDSSRPPGPGLC